MGLREIVDHFYDVSNRGIVSTQGEYTPRNRW